MAPSPEPPPADEGGGEPPPPPTPPAPPLVVQDASLQTAALEFQAVLLDGRRLTMAGFRQLLEEPLIDAATGQLRGRIWGWVNYHPDRCAAAPPHRHVLWQLGRELRRAWVPGAVWDTDPQTLLDDPDDPAPSPLWGQPFAAATRRLLQRRRLYALCLGLREPDAPFAPPPAEDGRADAAPGRRDVPAWAAWTWWASRADPDDREVGHVMWNHLRFRAEEIRTWAGVPLDATPYPRPPTEAEAGGARALAAWIDDVEARGVQLEKGDRDPDDDHGPGDPDDESTWRLVLLGSRSVDDVDVPLLFGTPDAPDAADVLDLPVSPVVYVPAADGAGECLELAPRIAYDVHPVTRHRRAPDGPAPAPGYVRTTRTFPAVVQAVLMVESRMTASQFTFYLRQLLEQYAQEAGIPVAYVRDAGEAPGAWEEAREVAPETLAAVRAAFEEAQADRQALREHLVGSYAEVRAATQLFVAV